LLSTEALNNHVFLLFTEHVLLLKLFQLTLLGLAVGTEPIDLRILNNFQFSLVQRLKQALPSFAHFDQPRLQPLPQLVVLRSSDIGTVPHRVLDKLFYLVDPLSFQHILLDGLNSYHHAGNVLDEDVITGDEELLLLVLGARLISLHRSG
jgi:hypothetical protein